MASFLLVPFTLDTNSRGSSLHGFGYCPSNCCDLIGNALLWRESRTFFRCCLRYINDNGNHEHLSLKVVH